VEPTLIAAVRALHFAAAIVVFGQFAYLAAVAPRGELPPGFARTLAIGAVALPLTMLPWLALEAVSMSGLPVSAALGMETLTVVATQTVFGRLWVVRFLLAGVLLALVPFLQRHPTHRAALSLGALLAALLLATIAGAGHAVAGEGADRAAHLCADALHLLAAGAWLGALAPLIRTLARPDAPARSARLAQRFSALGVACMAAILLSGIVNAYYNLPDLAALGRTSYGLMLVAKISLFLLIVVLAAINRNVLMPRLARASGDAAGAARALRRNAIAECVLGFAIVGIVGVLGITVPGPHHH
jgi:putative copper resistance protein D